MNRIAYFWASWDVMLSGWQTRILATVTSNLPDDAQVHHLVLDHERRATQVFFTSETLAEVPEMGTIPEFVVWVSVDYPAVREA